MDRDELHRAVIASENFWFGGSLDAPKVWDSGTHHHADRDLKGSSQLQSSTFPHAGPGYVLRVDAVTDVWTVTRAGEE